MTFVRARDASGATHTYIRVGCSTWTWARGWLPIWIIVICTVFFFFFFFNFILLVELFTTNVHCTLYAQARGRVWKPFVRKTVLVRKRCMHRRASRFAFSSNLNAIFTEQYSPDGQVYKANRWLNNDIIIIITMRIGSFESSL